MGKTEKLTASAIKQVLQAHADAHDAVFLQRFFKTAPGQYGENDVFIGVRVPATRSICKQFKDMPIAEVEKLLHSEVHEHRLAAVILLAEAYKRADVQQKEKIFTAYLKAVNEGYVNNWDLVDTSAEFIIGEHLLHTSRELLFTLAKSSSVWQRRVAVLSSFGFIKHGDPTTTLKLAKKLLHDPHDLIQKAVGWMLREIGKRIDNKMLLDFLEEHYKTMPRTMLRYALEHLSPEQKAHFMKK